MEPAAPHGDILINLKSNAINYLKEENQFSPLYLSHG